MTKYGPYFSRDSLLFTSYLVFCIALIFIVAKGLTFALIGVELAQHESVSSGNLQLTALQ